MFDKLKDVEAKYNEISERLTDPAVVTDQEMYKKLMREHKQLTPIVDKLHEYEAAKND
ncbi:MAG: PCRF domain-containing protein, partial [Clostridia bacterium]|nr:PCRF domain-containing protein [Clostridia bacterium]